MLILKSNLIIPILMLFIIAVLVAFWIRPPIWVTGVFIAVPLFSFAFSFGMELYYRSRYRNGNHDKTRSRFGEIYEVPPTAIMTYYNGENWNNYGRKLGLFFDLVNTFRIHFYHKNFSEDPKSEKLSTIKDWKQFSMVILDRLRNSNISNETDIPQLENVINIFGYLRLSALDFSVREKLKQVSTEEEFNKLLVYEDHTRVFKGRIDSVIIINYNCLDKWEKNIPIGRDYWANVNIHAMDSYDSPISGIPIAKPILDWSDKRSLLNDFRNMRFVNSYKYIMLFDLNEGAQEQECNKAIADFYHFTEGNKNFYYNGIFYFYKGASNDSLFPF